jgi:hypothetical protein
VDRELHINRMVTAGLGRAQDWAFKRKLTIVAILTTFIVAMFA